MIYELDIIDIKFKVLQFQTSAHLVKYLTELQYVDDLMTTFE